MLATCNVNNDSAVGDGAILASGAVQGGHCSVGRGASLGFGAAVRPRRRIGPAAVVATAVPAVRGVPPRALVGRQRFGRVDRAAMERAGTGPPTCPPRGPRT